MRLLATTPGQRKRKVKIKVLFFASIREIFDCNEKIVDITYDKNLTPDLLLENFSIIEIKEKTLPHTYINKNYLKSIA